MTVMKLCFIRCFRIIMLAEFTCTAVFNKINQRIENVWAGKTLLFKKSTESFYRNEG